MKAKKIISMLLVGIMSFGLISGCSSKEENNTQHKVQAEHIDADTLLLDIMEHPAFEGFGQFLFARITTENAGERRLRDLTTEYAYNDPEISTEVINAMIDARTDGTLEFYDIYTEEEKEADPTKKDTGLFFFKGQADKPFAIINAGGAFSYVSSLQESFPHALALQEKGYPAFTLQYRTGMGAETAYKDLARAISFIFENAEELNVQTDNYSLWGASAGARMAAALGSYGPAVFEGDTLPAPAAVIMEYTGYTDYSKNDPPTYAVVGEDDPIADWRTMENRLKQLDEQGIDTEFHVYPDLGHGFGLGIGTTAEGWFEDAVAFWEAHMEHTRKIVDSSYYEPAEQQGTLERISYQTDSGENEAIVYVPYGYDQHDLDTRYNILYLQHGGGGNETVYMGDTDSPNKLKNMFDHMIENGEIEPMLIVAPHLETEGGYAKALRYAAAFPEEFEHELMPAVESKYHTYAEDVTEEGLRASRNHRAFAGFSMGSVTTWEIFMQSQEYVQYYMPMSGDNSKVLDMDASELSEDFFIFSATGTEDFDCTAFTNQIEAMKKKTSLYTYKEYPEDEGNLMFYLAEGNSHEYEASYEYIYNGLPLFFNTNRD